MKTSRDEEAALLRATTLARARRLASEWGYWCVYGSWGEVSGQRPHKDGSMGGIERRYKPPPMWYPPDPKWPEANEVSGIAVQRAFYHLPQLYRQIIRAEYCYRPWFIPLKEGELEVALARKARVSIGAYAITLDRALLALANVMKRRGLWGAT